MPSSSFIRSVSVFFAVSALTPASLNAAFCAVDVPMLTSCITQPRSGDIIITQNASMTMTDTVSVMSLTPLTWRRCFLCLDLRRREVRLVSALPLNSFSFVSSSAKTAASFAFAHKLFIKLEVGPCPPHTHPAAYRSLLCRNRFYLVL